MARSRRRHTRSNKPKRPFYKRKGLWVFLLICVVIGVGAFKYVDQRLEPYRERAKIYNMEEIDDVELPSLLLDRKGAEIGRMFVENRDPIGIEEVPGILIDALLAQEDQRFFKHKGVDWVGVVRAVYLNVKAGEVNQGASTITMQLARNAYDLKAEATARGESGIERKIVEAFLALRIEEFLNAEMPSEDRRLAKMKVLEYYLNRIPFGSGYYGVKSASLGYFGKEPKDLTIEECASIVACVKNPAGLTPLRFPEANKKARDHVLNRMLAEDMILRPDWARMTAMEVKVNPRPLQRGTSHLYEKVAGFARSKVGQEAMSRGDFKIYTTIDREAQREAEDALREQLKGIENVPGYQHPRYEDWEGGTGAVPDYLQGAALMVDSRSGAVRAYVGGRDYADSQFDFIELGRRPLGTAFLPFIYSAALADGWDPSTTVEDSQMDNRTVMVGGREGILGEWGMEVANPRYEGRITSRRALSESKIAASVRLGREVGLEEVIAHAKGFGFDLTDAKLLNRVFLGSEAASLREAVLAYSAFSQGGRMPTTLHFIERIENGEGETIYDGRNVAEGMREVPGLDGAGAFQVHSMLRDTLRTGNLRSEGTKPGSGNFPGVAKTGTTNTFSDGWCLGYNGTVSLGIWVGFAQGGKAPIFDGAFGRKLTYPAWAQVMSTAELLFPGAEVPVPDTLELVGICERSGLQSRTRHCYDKVETPEGERHSRTIYREYLRKDRPAMAYCDVHGPFGPAINEFLVDVGPDPGGAGQADTLPVTPIRPQAPALLGSDPYHSVVLSLAPASEDDLTIMQRPVFLQDFGLPGDEEPTFRLPLPEKIEIGLD